MYKNAKGRLACIALTVVLALGSTPMAAWGLENNTNEFGSSPKEDATMPTMVSDSTAMNPTANENPAAEDKVTNTDGEDPTSDTKPSTPSTSTEVTDSEGDTRLDVDASGADGSMAGSTTEKPEASATSPQDDKSNTGATEDSKPKESVEANTPEAAATATRADKAESDAVPAALVAPAPLKGVAAGGSVFMSATGSDDGDGLTAETAVKSFAKAKEILGAAGAQIRLLNTITIAQSETWELADGQMVIRDDSFTSGPMIHVNPGVSFTTRNIVIDGGFGTTNQGVTGSSKYSNSAAIIDSYGGATSPTTGTANINLNSGTVLRNNHVLSTNSNGGAIYAHAWRDNTARVAINGATIDNCTTAGNGGAIALVGVVKTGMFGGSTISNCSAGKDGGAVSVQYGGDFTMFGDSVISKCSAVGNGGGVYVMTHFRNDDTSTFTQKDSTIKECTAGGAGGGVFVQRSTYYLRDGGVIESCVSEDQGGGICLYEGAASLVTGTADNPVYIRNNTSKVTSPDGEGGGAFGGGGIYVDTTKVSGGKLVSQLYLGSTVIRDNEAATDGGGVAYCPLGGRDGRDPDANKFYENTTAIYGNSTGTGHSDDLAIVRHGTVTADGYEWTVNNVEEFENPNVSSTALGGAPYRWVGPDGTEYALSDLMDVDEFFGKSSIRAGDVPDSLAGVFIEGNSSACFGGGIACNGRINLVDNETEYVNLSISKKWETGEGTQLPESIRMWVVRSDGEKVGYIDVKPSDDGSWSANVEGLAKFDNEGNPYTYTVEEEEISGNGGIWSPSVETEVDGDGNTTASVTNTLYVKVDVNKVWVGESAGPVTVSLLADGKPVDGAVLELSEANGWASAFAKLPKYSADGHVIVYTIVEGTVEGYESSITGSAEEGFTVTNTENEEPDSYNPEEPESDEPKKPKSGKPEQIVYRKSVSADTDDTTPVVASLVLAASALCTALVVRRRVQ